MRKINLKTIATVALLVSLVATVGFAGDAQTTIYTVETMASEIGAIQGAEITVEGTIVGACKSGCKMWIADGNYEEGNLFTLVRAKDDAFTFDTKKNGKKVLMTGFVVAKYKDYCGDKAAAKEGEHPATEHPAAEKTETKEVAGSCAAPVKVETATKGELEEMTFFATTVKYVD